MLLWPNLCLDEIYKKVVFEDAENQGRKFSGGGPRTLLGSHFSSYCHPIRSLFLNAPSPTDKFLKKALIQLLFIGTVYSLFSAPTLSYQNVYFFVSKALWHFDTKERATVRHDTA